MSDAKTMTEKLIAEFSENYFEKLFYFCLKKTGIATEAEDLTQDIALNILTQLTKGTIPTNFSAWVWRIARNRYSVWADTKHKRAETVTGNHIGDYEIEDESGNILDGMVHSEQLLLLRRELAFIKSDYRNIVVAYYIENRSVRDIASSLSLSEGTVKQRLYRARTILKEGMDMAREFGIRSYNPEKISFSASGSQPSGLPWSAVGRLIPQNILLQASNNPSTPEELSIELGIALPYMEEEVELLHRATLLEKIGDKYITNFFILNKECRLAIYNALRKGSKERSRLLRDFIQDKLPEVRSLGIAEPQISDNAIKWWLVPKLIDRLISDSADGGYDYDPPKRANGENWGFVGYEAVNLPENTMMGHNGSGNGNSMFWAYKCSDWDMWDQCGELRYESALFFGECVRDGRDISSFTSVEKRCWDDINGRYAHSDESGRVVPDILVLRTGHFKVINQMLKEHRTYDALLKNFQDAYRMVKEIFKEYSHQILQSHMGYNILMEMYSMRMMAVHDLVDEQFLLLPDDPSISSLGMYMQIK